MRICHMSLLPGLAAGEDAAGAPKLEPPPNPPKPPLCCAAAAKPPPDWAAAPNGLGCPAIDANAPNPPVRPSQCSVTYNPHESSPEKGLLRSPFSRQAPSMQSGGGKCCLGILRKSLKQNITAINWVLWQLGRWYKMVRTSLGGCCAEGIAAGGGPERWGRRCRGAESWCRWSAKPRHRRRAKAWAPYLTKTCVVTGRSEGQL